MGRFESRWASWMCAGTSEALVQVLIVAMGSMGAPGRAQERGGRARWSVTVDTRSDNHAPSPRNEQLLVIGL